MQQETTEFALTKPNQEIIILTEEEEELLNIDNSI